MTFRCKHDWVENFYEAGSVHCCNCGMKSTVQKRNAVAQAARTRREPKRDADGFTAKQVERADGLVRYWLDRFSGSLVRSIKKEERRDLSGYMLLHVVIGRPGDEDTMAEIYCRERYMVVITREGGVSARVDKKDAQGRYRSRTLRGRAAVNYYEGR